MLADRAVVIRRQVEQAYPVTRKTRITYSGRGYSAGYAQGQRADIGNARLGQSQGAQSRLSRARKIASVPCRCGQNWANLGSRAAQAGDLGEHGGGVEDRDVAAAVGDAGDHVAGLGQVRGARHVGDHAAGPD